MAIITLTTDFGTADGYIGAMKGVILRLAGAHPAPVIVDLAHDIPPGDIPHAAWVLATSTTEFPHGSIHVVVVDPGVGGARREVIVRARNRWYVGPDNGVFGYIAERGGEAYAIESERFRAERVSRTFHGRDVFARTAAAIASGEDPAAAGPRIELVGQLPWGERDHAAGRVVHIDRFGNLISDLPEAEAGPAVVVADQTLALSSTYEDVAPGALLAYIGSAGTVEIAVRDGRADRRLGIARGAPVVAAPGDGTGRRGPYR
ncbi:MAG TPA: SAM-dependent chlorinase/fluorinase [Kofleriaceae bacterium]|nr:SAM-dependent chlorinase/fluorinase [Kofleriaceae bacterium]